jgi:glyoxylase-like metal-dependent hydrolase (beta-lactamase superfamily II)
MPLVPAILVEVGKRAETLRSLGQHGAGGHARDVISYSDADGSQIGLYFDRNTGDLLRVETLSTHPQLGDVAEALEFADYASTAGIRLPRTMRTLTGDLVVSSADVTDIVVGAPLDPVVLHRPAGADPAPPGPIPTGEAASTRVEEIVTGVWQVVNILPGYNTLFIEQDDGVVVIEAPGPDGESQAVLDAVHDKIPNKRITDLVLTHHHFDHTAAVGMYLAHGIPVTSTPATADFVKTLAAAPRSFNGAEHLAAPTVRVVEGRKMMGSGPNRFELIDVGPNPHSEEILIAYFPEHKLMYVPDIYGYYPGFTPPDLLMSFADRFDELGLDVEQIATAHTELGSIDEFQEMVSEVRGR